jgi:uncharacterized protein (DUF58 family)
MSNALAALTTRGRGFLAAGVTVSLCSVVLGQKDLLRVGILLAALPLVTALVVARSRYRLVCTRDLQPRRVPVGDSATVTLRLRNAGRMPTGVLLLEDRVPYVVGSRPRFVIDHMGSRWHQDVAYPVRSDVRGRYLLGPLTVRVSDPFGFVELTRSFADRSPMVVTPQVHALSASRLTGEWSGTGDNRPRAFAAAGTEDVTVREYRQGDDLRRVHWPSTARSGELMVRREEQPWQSRATLVLDTRKLAHRGAGPASSLEWAITATASVGAHLSRQGFSVRLVTDADRQGTTTAWHDRGMSALGETEALLEALAVVRPTEGSTLDLPSLSDQSGPGLLVAVVGALEPADLRSLGRLRHGGGTSLVMVLDIAHWGVDKDNSRRLRNAPTTSAISALSRQGWQVAVADGPEAQVAALWDELAARVRRPVERAS